MSGQGGTERGVIAADGIEVMLGSDGNLYARYQASPSVPSRWRAFTFSSSAFLKSASRVLSDIISVMFRAPSVRATVIAHVDCPSLTDSTSDTPTMWTAWESFSFANHPPSAASAHDDSGWTLLQSGEPA